MLRLNKIRRKSVKSKLLIGFNVLLVLLLAGPLSGVAFAGQGKTAVCHLDDQGNYIPISVADPALDTHLNHGDKVVGVDMDANCHPLDSDGDGVQDAVDNCVTIANPGQEDRYGAEAGDACEDLDGDGTLDVDEADFCLSINGVLLESRGLARCASTASTGSDPNVAVANGDHSGQHYYGAYAGMTYENYNFGSGNGLKSTAIGDGSWATTRLGFNNSAIAIDGGSAQIVFDTATSYGEVIYGDGGNNIATAIGTGSYATIVEADNGTATGMNGGTASVLYGNNSSATASGMNASARVHGGDNTASATGNGAVAIAQGGNNNSATANGASAVAVAAGGGNNSANATGNGAEALAYGGSNNSATSTGVHTCAGNGDDNEVAVDEDLCSN